MATMYRVRKNIFGKCILQEWVYFPDGLPCAPAPAWHDVDYHQAPVGLVATKQQLPGIPK